MKLSNLCKQIIDNLFAEVEQSERNIMAFGLEAIISTLISSLAVIILAYVLGVLSTTLVIFIVAGSFKIFSGGVHAKKFIVCALSSATIFSFTALGVERLAVILSDDFFIVLVWTVFLIASLAIYKYAPADTGEYQINNREKRLKLKIFSFLIMTVFILISFIFLQKDGYQILTTAILAGVFIQSFFLTPIAYTLFNR